MNGTPWPTVIVEIGFSGPDTGTALHLDDLSRGRLDTATLGADTVWTDVTGWVVSAQTRRGATRSDGPTLRYETGTATVVLRNEDRRFDPTNLDGPYVASGVTQVEPMRAVRLRAAWDGVTYPLWRGYADAWQVRYDGPTGSVVTLTASDAFSVFASYDRGESVAAGAGEDTGARINRVLDSITWPNGDRLVATGDSTVQATTLASNVLAELQLTADSEMGELYVDAQGRVVFRNRLALFEDTRSITPQAVFGDDTAGTELPYADVVLDYDAKSIYNLVSVARSGGTAQVVEDAASRSAYLTRTWTRTDLILETDQAALDYARYVLFLASEPELRIGSMRLRAQRDTRLWEHALGREIGDRVTVVRRPPGGGDPIERQAFVRGVEHDIGGDLSWTTTFVLQSATRGQFLVLDNSTLGRLDFNGLAY